MLGEQRHHAARRRRRRSPAGRDSSSPAFNGCRPSTSFAGSIARITRSSSMWAGSGSWTSIASTSSTRSAPRASRAARPRSIGRQAQVGRVDPRLGRRLVLEADVDLRGGVVADEHRDEADVPERPRPPRRPRRGSARRAACPSSASQPFGESRLAPCAGPGRTTSARSTRAAQAMGIADGLTTSVDLEPFAAAASRSSASP